MRVLTCGRRRLHVSLIKRGLIVGLHIGRRNIQAFALVAFIDLEW